MRSLPYHLQPGFASKGSLYAENDDDDDSSCDDTYVSMSSSRSRGDCGSSSKSSSRKSDSLGILEETSRVTNKTRPRRASSSSPFKSSKKSEYDKKYDEKSSTTGILDKLKNDINDLELLRLSTEEFPENEFAKFRTVGTTSSSNFGNNRRSKSSMRVGGSSMEMMFSENDTSSRKMTAGKPPTAGGSITSCSTRKEKNMGNDDLVKKFKMFEKDNERLQEVVRILKEDSIKNIQHNENKLSRFSDVKVHLSDVKLQLEQSKSTEAELEKALREVTGNAEGEQEIMSEELSIAYKLHKNEVALLEEKLRAASDIIDEKSSIIQALEIDMERRHNSLSNDKEETEQKLCAEIDNIKLSMKSNESDWIEKVERLEELVERSRTAYSELGERWKKGSEKMELTEVQNRELQEESEEVKGSLTEARDESQVFAKKLDSAVRENQSLTKTLDEKTSEVAELEETLACFVFDTRQKDEELNALRLCSKQLDEERTKEIETLKNNIEQLKQDKETTEEASARLASRLEEEKGEMQCKIDMAQKEMSELETEKQDEVDALRMKVAAMEVSSLYQLS